MKLSIILGIITSVAFPGVVWALPPRGSSDPLVSRRSAQLQQSNPNTRIEELQPEASGASSNATIQFSGNWSGAVLVAPPEGEIFTSAVGTFTVPSLVPNGNDGAAAAWVGIDGDTFATAILQAGVFFSVSGDTVQYGAWYEWWPNFATDIDTNVFPISAGDVITVNIDATSNSEGTVSLINQSSNTSFAIDLVAPTKLSVLGGQNAEWIVEDYTQNGGLVPLADWGTVTFVNASASTSANNKISLQDATIFDIEQFNDILTSVTIGSDSSVAISHT
ncbi:acid protease [Lentinula raphanica]|uniref:Acid protease n=1 Tax=Lentinula raphanica TaxID=153919 RepID=A0AA38U688_9AGAR|nr:acid protease [Lentinula raphanica]KAJ3833084.1 acid protease [Lentinula raphanica]KAJ3966294.1 acid protease [Lentinula raphanica]